MFIFQGCKFASMNCLVGVHGFQSIIHPTCELELKSGKKNTQPLEDNVMITNVY